MVALVPCFLHRDLDALSSGQEHLMAAEHSVGSDLGSEMSAPRRRRVLGEQSDGARQPPSAGETPPGTQVQQQQCYLGDLRQRIIAAQIRARQTPELDRTSISRRIKDSRYKQRLLGEETRPSGLQQQPQQDRGAEREVEAAVPSDSRVSLSLDTFTTSPPMPDPTDQLSEKISSEEYLPQATSYCPRTGHCSKHALRSSGKGQLCTARKALAGTGASAPGICFSVGSESASVQEMERVAFPELLMPEGPQGKERDLPEPENSESDDSQISEDSLAEKGCRSLRDSPGDSYLTSGHGHPRARAGASVRVFTTSSDSGLFTQTQKSFSLDSLIDTEEELGDHRQEEPFFISADEMPTETFWHLQPSSLPGGDQEAACRLGAIKHRTGARLDAILPVSSSFYLDPQPPCEQPELAVEANSSERAHAVQDSDLASWASMHNLSLHLSQLLHSTSELLGSLSQPSVAEKERNAKRETPVVMDLPGARCDCSSGEQGQRPPEPPADQSQAPEWSQREQIPLQVGAQNLSLSVELTEAKLHHGFGEVDALLQVLQSGTGEALAAEEPEPHPQGELYAWPKQTLENLRRERAERLQNFRRARSLSPQKQLSFPSSRDLPTRDLGLPSRRREYLQQLRRDVVETTRSPGSASRSAHPPSDIELMLQEYQRAREEAKVEIARARDRLRERTEQEKLRIRQQIISQLLREEEKLHTLAASSSRCTSSDGSLSSGVTSGYNSSPALPGQLQSPDSVVDTNLPDSRDSWMGDVRGRSAVRNSHLNLAGSAWKSLAYSEASTLFTAGRRASLGSCCCSPSSLSSLGTSSSSSYRDLAKHIVDISMADVMAACSDNLNNLFSHRAAAGWNHQGEEQEVQLYNKVFSSTRHGFLGAGVVSQPLSHVWAAVSDPTLWPLYHQPIQTARLHQRVTNSINLVYLVCNTALCAMKQPRDFCCVCVEAKEVPALPVGPLSIMAAQSVYDVSMPRPSREMVRGEILPSAWILQPLTVEGKEVTRVIYLAQVICPVRLTLAPWEFSV
ncbi:StAR-related lipid transfer protein 9 [Camelus dromedarius]|uniref:StAR-related lipid transfer protein 9 n=1 Tax=Camelus dromedarius TaxID=9838 RepID=A0A5N4E139_CAMDR|nr:StAR-related lipid transfer protein 9 [Camelus dromedarius]